MKIISHRAINEKYPENSLPSIQWAFESGYGIEIDIRINKNGNLVVIHDEDCMRLFNDPRKVIKMNDKECKDIGICSFEDVCVSYIKIGKEATLALHIKDINEFLVVEKTISILNKYNLKDNCFIFAVDDQTIPLINKVKEKYPQIKVALHLPENSHLFNEENFEKADVIWIDEESGNWINNKIVDLAKKTNSQVFCMSPEFVPNNIFRKNYKQKWIEFINLGVNAIITDYADELREFVSEKLKDQTSL